MVVGGGRDGEGRGRFVALHKERRRDRNPALLQEEGHKKKGAGSPVRRVWNLVQTLRMLTLQELPESPSV